MEFSDEELNSMRMAIKYAIAQKNESILAYNYLSANDSITARLIKESKDTIKELEALDHKIHLIQQKAMDKQ